jgi:hypothetical protein
MENYRCQKNIKISYSQKWKNRSKNKSKLDFGNLSGAELN